MVAILNPSDFELRVLFVPHAEAQIKVRRYSKEVLIQIIEQFWAGGVLQDSVLRKDESLYGDGRMVLIVRQGTHHHRLIYGLSPSKDTGVNGKLIMLIRVFTVVYKGRSRTPARAPMQLVDRSYELPTKDWERFP